MVPVRSAVSSPEFPAAYSVTARSIVRMNGDMHAAAVTPATAESATSTVLGTASSTSRGRAGAAGPPPPMAPLRGRSRRLCCRDVPFGRLALHVRPPKEKGF